eukprot:m.439295 g.439295  ORF g.439295 m.439295 type:complete len:653 (+) comp21449_c0_seq2:110-2068(+)
MESGLVHCLSPRARSVRIFQCYRNYRSVRDLGGRPTRSVVEDSLYSPCLTGYTLARAPLPPAYFDLRYPCAAARCLHASGVLPIDTPSSQNNSWIQQLVYAAVGATTALVTLFAAEAALGDQCNRITAQCDSLDGHQGEGGELELVRAAVAKDHVQMTRLLESGVPATGRHPFGWTALHVAAMNGDQAMCKLLLEAGADPNVLDTYDPRDARSAREHFRKLSAREREFSTLVDPNAATHGFTPLHYACLGTTNNARKVIDLLEKYHADPRIRDKTGHVAADYADGAVQKRMAAYATAFEEWRAQDAEKRQAAEREQRRLFPLEQRVKQKLVGQDGPINAVAAAIRRRENGWHDDEHPLVFLFLGSSGLGKTELAKQVANYIHSDDREGFIRMDMTEYQSKHEAAKFIGSPPGYVGYEEGGQLTKLLASKPNAVVLLDEVEKAHPDVLNLMLQLFDEGRITDGQGKTIECKDAIFVMTSNLASDEIAEYGVELRKEAALLGTSDETMAVSKSFKQTIIRPILKHHFQRDEFLGRIDEMLYFLPFSDSELDALVTQQLQKWAEKAKARHDIELTWDKSVLPFLAQEYDVHYGARSLQHAVDQLVVNRLAHAHEQGTLLPHGTVHLSLSQAAPGKPAEIVLTTSNRVKQGSSWWK